MRILPFETGHACLIWAATALACSSQFGGGSEYRGGEAGSAAGGPSGSEEEEEDEEQAGPADSGTEDAVDTAGDPTAPADTAGSADTAAVAEPCGDGTCAADEDCWSCASDCGACDCPTPTEVVFYTQSAWNVLADAMLADPSPCADYWFSLPANSGDKTTPRSDGEPEAMHARGPRLHAAAEFHWGTWADVSGSWYDNGVEFRRRMEDAGYDVASGDTWAVNELPSTVRYDDETRTAALDLFRGLYDGPDGDGIKGIAFVVGMGQGTVNFSVYKPYVEDWIEDADFWVSANNTVRFWAQEVYADPDNTCVADTTVAEGSAAINAFSEHFARHAEVGPSTANTAQSYLGRAYLPLMNAAWNSDDNGYGDTTVPLETMEHFVSHQVYAARAWAGTHNHPDGRLGFAWGRIDTTDADLAVLAGRLASSIHYAYDEGGGVASGACSPSGAYTWCNCEVSGAAFNDGWDTFEDW